MPRIGGGTEDVGGIPRGVKPRSPAQSYKPNFYKKQNCSSMVGNVILEFAITLAISAVVLQHSLYFLLRLICDIVYSLIILLNTILILIFSFSTGLIA